MPGAYAAGMSEPAAPRRRRRAVGPTGSSPAAEPVLDLDSEPHPQPAADDDERLIRDRPPHHDRGV